MASWTYINISSFCLLLFSLQLLLGVIDEHFSSRLCYKHDEENVRDKDLEEGKVGIACSAVGPHVQQSSSQASDETPCSDGWERRHIVEDQIVSTEYEEEHDEQVHGRDLLEVDERALR